MGLLSNFPGLTTTPATVPTAAAAASTTSTTPEKKEEGITIPWWGWLIIVLGILGIIAGIVRGRKGKNNQSGSKNRVIEGVVK